MKTNRDTIYFSLVVAGFVLIVILGIWGHWYRAGLQAEVYRREGIEMTQWEVFMGSKPAERSINLKQVP